MPRLRTETRHRFLADVRIGTRYTANRRVKYGASAELFFQRKGTAQKTNA